MRDYTASVEVEIKGITYGIGWVPRGKVRSMSLDAASAQRRATRRAILLLKSEGIEEPAEDAIREARFSDAKYLEDVEINQRELVRWGLRTVKGENVASEQTEYLGKKYPTVPSSYVADLADLTVFAEIYSAILDHNTMSEEAKKN